jgi:hypothetical protein
LKNAVENTRIDQCAKLLERCRKLYYRGGGKPQAQMKKGGRIFARYTTSIDGNSDWFSVGISLIDSVSLGNETSDSKQALHVGHSQM